MLYKQRIVRRKRLLGLIVEQTEATDKDSLVGCVGKHHRLSIFVAITEHVGATDAGSLVVDDRVALERGHIIKRIGVNNSRATMKLSLISVGVVPSLFAIDSVVFALNECIIDNLCDVGISIVEQSIGFKRIAVFVVLQEDIIVKFCVLCTRGILSVD